MLPIPAIDLKDGQCVRLKQGRMEDATVFSHDPVQTAAHWIEQGANRLHLVDLNGAFAGSPQNADVVRAIMAAFPHIPLQIGGGIRDEATACHYWDLGVQYCIIGSKAVSQPQAVAALAAKYPQRLILGIDAKDGYVATDGWANISAVKAAELAAEFDPAHFAAIIYTDISKDGMMGGVNIEQTSALARATPIPVIASGGVSGLADIQALKNSSTPIAGAIIGRALYDGAFSLSEAYQTAGISPRPIRFSDSIDNAVYAQALALRRAVFIEEQGVSEAEEIDSPELEARCRHLVLQDAQGNPLATARFYLKDAEQAKIQRVAVAKSARGSGAGKAIMLATEAHARKMGAKTAVLGAQVHALDFYRSLGYEVCSEEYLDADISHRDMQKTL